MPFEAVGPVVYAFYNYIYIYTCMPMNAYPHTYPIADATTGFGPTKYFATAPKFPSQRNVTAMHTDHLGDGTEATGG